MTDAETPAPHGPMPSEHQLVWHAPAFHGFGLCDCNASPALPGLEFYRDLLAHA
jgi:hypothetical protein